MVSIKSEKRELDHLQLPLLHSDDDISLFVPFFHIAMSLGNVFQWIASIYDRLELSRLNELSEEDEICFPLFEARGRKDGLFATFCSSRTSGDP